MKKVYFKILDVGTNSLIPKINGLVQKLKGFLETFNKPGLEKLGGQDFNRLVKNFLATGYQIGGQELQFLGKKGLLLLRNF